MGNPPRTVVLAAVELSLVRMMKLSRLLQLEFRPTVNDNLFDFWFKLPLALLPLLVAPANSALVSSTFSKPWENLHYLVFSLHMHVWTFRRRPRSFHRGLEDCDCKLRHFGWNAAEYLASQVLEWHTAEMSLTFKQASCMITLCTVTCIFRSSNSSVLSVPDTRI